MTDKEKLDFVIAEIERRLLGDYNSENNEFDIIAQGVCASILYFAKSVQEQPSAQPSKMSVEAAMAELDEKIKAFSEKTKGESAEQILAEMRGEEPVSEDLEEGIQRAFSYHESHGDDFRSDSQIETTFRYGFASGAKWQKEQMTSCIEQCRNEHLKCKECTDDDRDKALHQYAADICGVMLTRINGCVIIKED